MAIHRDRRFFRDSTAKLRKHVADAMNWYSTLHLIYVELSYRERPAAKKLRAELAAYFKANGSYFPWPTTEAKAGEGETPRDAFEHEVGLLGYVGYKVGNSGVATRKRLALLDDVYLGDLPLVNSPEYMAKWGEARSSKRLQQMAVTIAELAKSRKRNDATRYAEAIRDWEADLEYLRKTYYEGTYSFAWPKTAP